MSFSEDLMALGACNEAIQWVKRYDVFDPNKSVYPDDILATEIVTKEISSSGSVVFVKKTIFHDGKTIHEAWQQCDRPLWMRWLVRRVCENKKIALVDNLVDNPRTGRFCNAIHTANQIRKVVSADEIDRAIKATIEKERG